MKKLKIVVEEVRGECHAGYQEGDIIEVEDPVINGKLCIYAISALVPYITAAYRDTPPEDWINVVEVLQCPDPENTVTFKLIRE